MTGDGKGLKERAPEPRRVVRIPRYPRYPLVLGVGLISAGALLVTACGAGDTEVSPVTMATPRRPATPRSVVASDSSEAADAAGGAGGALPDPLPAGVPIL